MLLQFDTLTADAILGASLMFGLALVFSYVTYKSIGAFLIWLTVFNAFVVWGGLLPLWTLVLNLVVLTIVIFAEMKSKGSVGE